MKKILLTVFLLIFLIEVNALSSFPDEITTKSEGDGLTLNNNHSLNIDTSHNANSEHYYPYFHVKNSKRLRHNL